MNNAIIETKTKTQIAEEMKISLRTLQRRLNKSGLKIPRGHISPDLQQAIFRELGWTCLSRSDAKWHEMARNGAKSID